MVSVEVQRDLDVGPDSGGLRESSITADQGYHTLMNFAALIEPLTVAEGHVVLQSTQP